MALAGRDQGARRTRCRSIVDGERRVPVILVHIPPQAEPMDCGAFATTTNNQTQEITVVSP